MDFDIRFVIPGDFDDGEGRRWTATLISGVSGLTIWTDVESEKLSVSGLAGDSVEIRDTLGGVIDTFEVSVVVEVGDNEYQLTGEWRGAFIPIAVFIGGLDYEWKFEGDDSEDGDTDSDSEDSEDSEDGDTDSLPDSEASFTFGFVIPGRFATGSGRRFTVTLENGSNVVRVYTDNSEEQGSFNGLDVGDWITFRDTLGNEIDTLTITGSSFSGGEYEFTGDWDGHVVPIAVFIGGLEYVLRLNEEVIEVDVDLPLTPPEVDEPGPEPDPVVSVVTLDTDYVHFFLSDEGSHVAWSRWLGLDIYQSMVLEGAALVGGTWLDDESAQWLDDDGKVWTYHHESVIGSRVLVSDGTDTIKEIFWWDIESGVNSDHNWFWESHNLLGKSRKLRKNWKWLAVSGTALGEVLVEFILKRGDVEEVMEKSVTLRGELAPVRVPIERRANELRFKVSGRGDVSISGFGLEYREVSKRY